MIQMYFEGLADLQMLMVAQMQAPFQKQAPLNSTSFASENNFINLNVYFMQACFC